MAIWVYQFEKPSKTPSTKKRVEYLESYIDRKAIETTIYEYFQDNPSGEEVTLACFNNIGEQKLRQIAKDIAKDHCNKKFDQIKRDFGLLVPIVMGELFGEDKVLTYRKNNGKECNPISVSLSNWKELRWIGSFTPHKID
ncbi:MAG: hypothetical protein P9L92_03410 [Candidatus Electryonea clarkiae]|nr:hypothetical protein [Candidatus Electryonea clarkiae]MDP8286794.1 hypothetical protein [Candidatus Electryonea clarkiae]